MPDIERAQPKCRNCNKPLRRRHNGTWVHESTRSLYCEGRALDDVKHAEPITAQPRDEIR